jgi:hypothetical protein
MAPAITQERLHELLNYNEADGTFTWRVSRKGNKGAGSIAGSKATGGYMEICVDRQRFFVHRLVFLYVEGCLPPEEVDHIDGNRSNNRFSNLRHISRGHNKQNMRVATKRSIHGFLGVSFNKPMQKFEARIRHKNVVHRLGYFENPEDAHAAYVMAKRKIHPFGTL